VGHAAAQASLPADSIRAPEAAAEPSYDQLLDQAVVAFDASDFARARSLFEQAFRLRPNARVLRGMGIAALRLERYSEAYRALSEALKHQVQPLTATQRDEATSLLSWMETTLASVRLHWTPAEPKEYELLVDGSVLKEPSIWLLPGSHRVAVHAAGFGAVERTLMLAAEQHEVIELTLSARESPQAATPRTPTIAASEAARSIAPERPASRAPEQAIVTPVTNGHAAETRKDSGSGGLLTRWWFWTVVGAVVAGGVTTAVLMSQPAAAPEPPDPAHLATLPALNGP
jgi:hypothetical protein